MTFPNQKVITAPPEIKAAQAWFASNFNPNQIAGSFAPHDGKLSGLLCLPPVSQATLNAILTFAQAAIESERKGE